MFAFTRRPAPSYPYVDVWTVVPRVHEDDEAKAAAKLTGLDTEDFTRLPPYAIYASLQNEGRRTGWFSAQVLPPPKAISSASAILTESQARYGVPAAPPAESSATESASAHTDDDEEPLGRAKRSRK